MREPVITHAALQRAMERGVISQTQLDALLSASRDVQSPPPPEPIEAPEAFNAITVAYYIGAFVVLFGFGWFLLDRWRALGPSGFLLVTLVYGGLFLGTAFYLRRHGYSFAAAVATLLAVGMTPLITWSVLKLTGAWPEQIRNRCEWVAPWVLGCRGKWMIIELTTILASLVALRTVRYALLMKPIAVALVILCVHLTESLFGYVFDSNAAGWAIVASASVIMVLGYLVDLQNDTEQDYAFWLYLPGLVAASVGMVLVWSFDRSLRHALVVIAIVTMAIAVYMRRRTFLAFGAAWFIWYLAFIAFDVFRNVVALPIVLATMGLLVILGAVWLQRNYPRFVARVTATTGGKRFLPGSYTIFVAPALLALLMIPVAAKQDRERFIERKAQQRVWAIKWAHQKRTARKAPPRDSAKPVVSKPKGDLFRE